MPASIAGVTQRLMNPAEVVVHEIERQRVLVIFQLF
jgi:hypothetical protein